MAEWTVKTILDWIEGYLAQQGDAHARLSAQWLVADVLHCSRIELYADLARPLTLRERDILRDYTKRRGAGEPLQYITGSCDFRFLTLEVAPGVLIPRPETEVLVSEALHEVKTTFLTNTSEAETGPESLDEKLEQEPEQELEPEQKPGAGPEPESELEQEPEQLLVVDVCTGSGNIACAVASELAQAYVYATDVSPESIALAEKNVSHLGLEERVMVMQGDLCQALPKEIQGQVQLLISNPPYIPTAELSQLDSEVADFEPQLALDGGSDGLDVFRRILVEANGLLCPDGVLAVELHETTLDMATQLAQSQGYEKVRIAPDLAGKPRVLIAHKPL